MLIKHGSTPDTRRVGIEQYDGLYYRIRFESNTNTAKEWRQASANVIAHESDITAYVSNYIQTGYVTRNLFIGEKPPDAQ